MSRSTQERIIMLLLPYKYYNILWWITVIYCALTHTHNNTIIHSYQHTHTHTHTNIGCIKENNLVLPLHMRQYYILAICRVRMIDRRRSNRHPGRKWHLGGVADMQTYRNWYSASFCMQCKLLLLQRVFKDNDLEKWSLHCIHIKSPRVWIARHNNNGMLTAW